MPTIQAFDYSLMPRLCGHRGAKGLAPENTLAGIQKAADIKLSFVELDINLAADDIVVFHDFDLKRCADNNTRLIDKRYLELADLEVGSHFSKAFTGEKIPRFTDAINLLSKLNIGTNIEIKTEPGNEQGTIDKTVKIIRARWPANLPLLLSSFSETTLALCRDLLPEVSRGYLVEALPNNWQAKMHEFEASSLHCWDDAVDKADIQKIAEQGYPTLVYTVNNRQRAKNLLDWGAASIITDHPDVMMDLNTID